MVDLSNFRDKINDLDERILELLAERLEVCREVGEAKVAADMPTMQPDRVKDVLKRVASIAEAKRINSAFAHEMWSGIIKEACRIEDDLREVANKTTASSANTQPNPSLLGQTAIRIDHVAIAVRDLEAAITHYQDKLGFELVKRHSIGGSFSGMDLATMEAGGVTFVLVQGTDPESNVCRYINEFGPGVQHLAVEVTRLEDVCTDLRRREFSLLGDIVQAGDLNQILSYREPNSGMQIEVIERTGALGFDQKSITNLFKSMEKENVY